MTVVKLLVLWIGCAIAAGVSLVWMLFAALAGSDRALRIAVGFDQTANAAIGGDEDETISARCWRLQHLTRYAVAVQIINMMFWDRQHCAKAYKTEIVKRMGAS